VLTFSLLVKSDCTIALEDSPELVGMCPEVSIMKFYILG
jgi:hypothetical protein